MKKQKNNGVLFLLPSLLGISIFVLIPFLDVIRRSFYEAMSGKFVGLANYRSVIENEAFKQAVQNTVRFIVVCIPLLLCISLILALLLHRQKKHKDFFKTSFLIPMAVPIASVALLWKLLFHENGLISGAFRAFGMEKIDFLNTDKAFLVLVISYLWKNTGYDMILWFAGLNGIDGSIYEAASVDGADGFHKFFYITLPLLSPAIFMVGILSFINSFKVFREAYLISGDYPQEKIYLLQHLFNNWFTSLDIQKMSAAAVLCVLFFIGILFLFQKLDRGGE